MQSKVHFIDLHVGADGSRLTQFKKLIEKSGLDDIDMEKKFVAIKMHFGEYGNLAFIRHNYVKVLSDFIKSKGGVPFLSDCNTLYPGSRKNAVEHLETAYLNGFTPYATGCPVIIGDGLKGDDDVEVPFDGEYIKKAYIGRSFVDADIIVTLTHFKCHEVLGIGGSIKNMAMGCASKRGKREQHSAGKPTIDKSLCKGCRVCESHCGSEAIFFKDGKGEIDHLKCAGCGMCIASCRFDAIVADYDASIKDVSCRLAEYAAATIKGKPNFHFSMITDVSPFCDCHAGNDVPIVPDIGFLASKDPVAIDRACTDMVNAQVALKGSKADVDSELDVITRTQVTTDWRIQLAHAEKIGMGTQDYKIVKLK